jgi:hypothetical protein
MIVFRSFATTMSQLKFSVVHSPTNALFIKRGKVYSFTLEFTQISLLHVPVFDHHQAACTEPG